MEKEKILFECQNNALHCLGTSYVFQKKAQWYEKLLRYNTILGLLLPLTIGAIALSYADNPKLLKTALILAAPFSVVQIILSGLALANKWDSKLSYSLESQSANRILYDKYRSLPNLQSNNPDLNHLFELIRVEDGERTKQDERITVKSKETRMGMRYALFIMQRICVGCLKIPESMDPSQCSVCGKF